MGWKVFSTSRDLEFQFDDRRRERETRGRLTDKKDTVEPKVAWEKLARGRRREKAVAVNG